MFDDLLGGETSPSEAPSADSAPSVYELDERGMSELLGLSLSMVRTKAREGVFVRSNRGRYDVHESVRRYVSRLREAASRNGSPASAASDELKAEKLRLTRAQATAQEQKNRLAAGEMVAVSEVRAEWVTVATDLRSQILAIPPRVAARAGLNLDAAVILEEEMRLALEGLHDER
ncbi:hypothetical protein [Paracoccus jeotgali]|nr:hypothetical protein [Paracoccus jeotgali]